MGLEYSTYKSGNVSSATLKGEDISNSQAKKILARLSYAKFWFDVSDGLFYGRDVTRDEMIEMKAILMAKIEG